MRKFNKNMCTLFLKLYAVLLLTSYSLSALAHNENDAVFILDNTASSYDWGLVASLEILNSECDRILDVIAKARACNASDTRQTTLEETAINVQIIQNDNDGTLTNMIGFDNSNGVLVDTSENYKTNIFPPTVSGSADEDSGQLFSLKKYRYAADVISKMEEAAENSDPPTNDPATKTWGTISFQDFVINSRNSTAMYGIVRVKIPVHKIDDVYTLCGFNDCTDSSDADNDDANADSDDTDNDDTNADSDDTDNDDANIVCGPGEGAKRIRIGGQGTCGQHFNSESQILVYGSLFMDFVNVKTDEAISLQKLPTDLTSLYFAIEIPININPASSNNSSISNIAPRVIDEEHLELIRDLSGNNTCSSGDSCNEEITGAISFGDVPHWARERYQYKMGESLSEELFSNLSKDKQFNLLMPPGYDRGWETAIDELNITATQWASLGFSAIGLDSFTLEQIRSDQFEDIPAFIYSGGVLSIRHHANISGLIYSPNSLEIMQGGSPSRQYINGAIIVRDGFYINFFVKNGITVVSNNPDTYAKIKLKKGSSKYGIFKRFKNRIHPAVAKAVENGEDIASIWGHEVEDSVQTIFGERLDGFNNPGPQWTEIKPQ